MQEQRLNAAYTNQGTLLQKGAGSPGDLQGTHSKANMYPPIRTGFGPKAGRTAGSRGRGQEPAPVVMSRKFPFCSANKSFLIPLLARHVMKQLQLQILRARLIPSLVSSYPLIDLPRAYTLQQGDDGSVLKSSGISHRPGAHAAAQHVPPQLCILGAAGEAPGPRKDLRVPPRVSRDETRLSCPVGGEGVMVSDTGAVLTAYTRLLQKTPRCW